MPLPDWARAHGPPLFTARIRSRPDDFEVTEVLGWELSGDGEHDYLWVEKTGANTEWDARQLARHADVPAKDIGYAGLKDRHAVTRQWFSVRRPTGAGTDWAALAVDGVTLPLFGALMTVPFNIASYALLTLMIAQVSGLQPGEFIHTFGDAHIYNNHLEQIHLQLSRDPRPLPTMKLNPEVTDLFAFRYEDFTLENYDPHPHIKGAVAA